MVGQQPVEPQSCVFAGQPVLTIGRSGNVALITQEEPLFVYPDLQVKVLVPVHVAFDGHAVQELPFR